MIEFEKYFNGKTILVTGGTGSIGSEIVRQLLKYKPKQIRVYSRDEFKQFNLQNELNNLPIGFISYLIGDVRDKERLMMACEGVDIIFHAAALKHVPFCEYNPFEAVKTNVLGTQNVAECARNQNVENVVAISTDKAASPINTMGATKLLAEKIILNAQNYVGYRKTKYTVVRFGNVLGSRGSVVPLFIEQIKKYKEITLTDPQMTRFLISIPQAVNLVFKACVISKGKDLFILKMPVVNLLDLAEVMIDILSKKYGYKNGQIKVKIIGKRKGEKKYEILISEEESNYIYENGDMFCLTDEDIRYIPNGFHESRIKIYRSSDLSVMSKEKIHDCLTEFINEGFLNINSFKS